MDNGLAATRRRVTLPRRIAHPTRSVRADHTCHGKAPLQPRRPWQWLGLLLLGVLATAHAGVFVQPEGAGRVIITGVATRSPRGFDAHGHVAPIADYNQDQLYISAEYGLSDNLTLILAPSYRSVRVENDANSRGLGYTEAGVRYRLAQGSNWLMSTQASIRIPGQGRSDRIAQLGNTSTDLDLRLGAAWTTATTFLTGEGGYRLRSGGQANEFHVDLTAGLHLGPRVMLLASVFNTFSDGASTGVLNQKYRYGDAYFNVAWELNKRVTVMAGYTATLYGKNALRQRGPVIGLWINF